MKVLDIVSVNTPSALMGQKNVPDVFKNKKFKKSINVPKVKKGVYGGIGGNISGDGNMVDAGVSGGCSGTGGDSGAGAGGA